MISLFSDILPNKIERWIEPMVVIGVAFIVGRIFSFLIKRYIKKSSQVLKVDPTNYSFIQHAVSLIVFIIATYFVFRTIPQLRTVGTTIFAGAGIIAAIIGFASQEAFSNIVSGIFLVIYKPFSVGDYIKLVSNNYAGIVEDINLRHTVIRSIENRRIVIPNSVISRESILNSNINDQRIHNYIDVTIQYQSDLELGLKIMQEICESQPQCLDMRREDERQAGKPKVAVQVVELAETGVKCRAAAWSANNESGSAMKAKILLELKLKFDEAGIRIAESQQNQRHD
jgi:small conductance mechanosensitive channel